MCCIAAFFNLFTLLCQSCLHTGPLTHSNTQSNRTVVFNLFTCRSVVIKHCLLYITLLFISNSWREVLILSIVQISLRLEVRCLRSLLEGIEQGDSSFLQDSSWYPQSFQNCYPESLCTTSLKRPSYPSHHSIPKSQVSSRSSGEKGVSVFGLAKMHSKKHFHNKGKFPSLRGAGWELLMFSSGVIHI